MEKILSNKVIITEEVHLKLEEKVSSESLKNGRDRLVITSIPYQVNKSVLNERIAQLVREKKIEVLKI